MTVHFDLVDDPWVLVLDEHQRVHEISLVDLFTSADKWRSIAGEVPTQQAAVLRFLLAICHRALSAEVSSARAGESWELWWRGGLPADQIVTYLRAWQHRFDLFDKAAPFMQVAGLRTAKGSTSGLSKLIADVPDGAAFFTTRAGSGLDSIDAAEAARWVIHSQAYDISGIKSGAVGDDRVKGGKGYPIGTGWCGQIGLVIAEGSTLAETLLLNLVLTEPSSEGDRPPWERDPPLSAGVDTRRNGEQSSGPVELLVWQGRRLRLFTDEHGRVVDALVCNGDAISGQNRHGGEAMTAWRRSDNQEKRGDHGPVVYMPVRHDPGRAVWRGLGGLLAGAAMTHGSADDNPRLLPPLIDWLARLVDEDRLDPDHPVRFRAVGMEYGSQSSVISGLVDDVMILHAAVLTDAELRQSVVDAVESTEAAVRAVRNLAANLARAAGGDEVGVRDSAAERAWDVLDRPFRAWAAGLNSTTDTATALAAWHRNAFHHLREVGLELVVAAGDKAWRGREVTVARGTQFIDTALAETWFRAALSKALDRAFSASNDATSSTSAPEKAGD